MSGLKSDDGTHPMNDTTKIFIDDRGSDIEDEDS